VIAAKNTNLSGHQPRNKTDLVKELVPEDRKITICEVADMLGIVVVIVKILTQSHRTILSALQSSILSQS
jgi:hypothetical protein